jgi:hypothetical protein
MNRPRLHCREDETPVDEDGKVGSLNLTANGVAAVSAAFEQQRMADVRLAL